MFFPRRIEATSLDKRPKETPVASITYHLRSTSPGFAI
ncbi:50S ribosomal protein L13 [Listeria monocytogenes]|nr:50S ribosomal protein L13 [Listeria monocytogenes]